MMAGRVRLCLALCFVSLAATPGARAQTPPGTGSGNSVTLPGSTGQPTAGNGNTCVQTQIGNEKPSPYNCLNQQLQQQTQGGQGAPGIPPVTSSSPSNQVGTFNRQGLSEQYGKNFGKSVIPYRPPAPVYGNSLHP
jgi:hypothetical protein